ncbi:TPA: hypothetical protein EYP13_05140 [Candidatus Micrarchaeota archaeon]|nr:hypothetical protein [Candidatus Micrarchaeota archaeon]
MKENKLLATQESKDTTIKTKKIQKEKEIVLGEKLKKELLTSVEEFISEMEKFLPQVKEIFPVEAKELEDVI